MRIEVTFKYTSTSIPTMHMNAYDITSSKGLKKAMGVLKKLGEAMEICSPPEKSKSKEDENGNASDRR